MKLGFLFLGLLLLPSLALANIVINEIAWMGTAVSSADEWIELYNSGSEAADLTGWILKAQDDVPTINLSGSISANSFFLLERTDDTTVPSITADLIYTGALVDTGETLILQDKNKSEVQKVIGDENWQNIGGDKNSKQTAQYTISGWITATATPKAMNASVSEPPPQEPQQPPSQSSGGDNSSYIPPEKLPKIKAYAGEDKTVTVGASVEFRGQAFGLENELLDNARYLWTFGDGATKEGQNIVHFYRYPGEYIVVLNVSSGEYSASDRILVKAVPNQVFISEIKTWTNNLGVGEASWIEFENKSKEEIDISGSQIKYNNQVFIFPQSTRIRPNAYLVIPSSVSGMVFYPGKGNVEFFYSGGFKADIFNYDGFLSGNESFIRDMGDKSSIAQETPGAKNSAITVNIQKSSNEKSADIKIPSKTSDVGEKTSDAVSGSSAAENSEVSGNQNAAVITVGNSGAKSNFKIYLLAILGLIVLSAGGILLVRRKRFDAKV